MFNCSKCNFNEFQTVLSDMNMQKNVRFECQTENIQKLKQEKCKDIQGLEFLFSNSRTINDFQFLYQPWNPLFNGRSLITIPYCRIQQIQ